MKLDRLEIDCRICRNCTGEACKIYGADAEEAVNSCASDGFKHYEKSKKKEVAK